MTDIIYFTKDMFINNYNDPENDKPCMLAIMSNPLKGIFYFKGEIINAPFQIYMCDIDELEYRLIPGSYDNDTFLFKIIDSNINNPKASNMATFTIVIGARPNQPPSSVGNNTVNTAYNTPITITTAMLTTQTVPAYADPEGDAPSKLKVLTLPSQGTLKLNNVNVTANQEIPFTAITAGQLTYTPNNATVTAHSVNFTFAISDVGSQQFTS